MTRKSLVKAPSDSCLQTLWRKVVRAEWGGVCALLGYHECEGSLECHHIIKRRRLHLKHVPVNGVLLCQGHHVLVESYRLWRREVESKVGADKIEWLEAEERKLLPAFLAERGQTRTEYLVAQKAYLQNLLDKAEE